MNTDSVLSVQEGSKSYIMGNNTVPALKSVCLVIQAGEFVALQGPSGSGKSTLLNICGLIDELDNGHLQLEGEDITLLSKRQRTLLRRQRIGFIFQNFNLVPVMTAYENIEYVLLLDNIPRKICQKQVMDILEKVGIAEFKNHLPDQLSGGQRQRVAIARALVKRPSLVMADEPTANLDSHTAQRIIEVMKQLCADIGASFLIATHDERMVRYCDRSVRLVDGGVQS